MKNKKESYINKSPISPGDLKNDVKYNNNFNQLNSSFHRTMDCMQENQLNNSNKPIFWESNMQMQKINGDKSLNIRDRSREMNNRYSED